jgi:hypothetical protein
MRIEGQEFEFVRASDLAGDGMGLECHRIDVGGRRTLVLEAFWHDPTGRFTVRCLENEFPFELMRVFLHRAAEGLPPVEAQEPGTKVLIYVGLLDEGVDVWRPVEAELVRPGVYRIVGQPPEDEDWQFRPGALVTCEEQKFEDGQTGLVAKRSAG